MENNKLNLESVIEDIGGCGRFQIVFALFVQYMKIAMGFGMVTMTFAGAVPDWWCDDFRFHGDNVNQSMYTFGNNTSPDLISGFKQCKLPNGTTCSSYRFDSAMSTVVSKWQLVCDAAWVPSITTSLQMAGVLIGNSLCGQIADLIGRKPPLFLSMIILSVFNFTAAFATSWIMFGISRFFIGLGCGFTLTLQYTIVSETTVAKWRSLVVAFPSWALMLTLFALMAYVTKHWQYIHLTIAVLALPSLATWCFVPESFRWYVSHDKTKEAQHIITRVANFNGRPVPDADVLERLVSEERADMEEQNDSSNKKYTVLDVLKSGPLRKRTIFFFLGWFSIGLVSYGIQFGVPALSGSIYVNMFVIGVANIPTQIGTVFVTNWLGRKRSAIMCMILCGTFTLLVGLASSYPVLDFGGRFKSVCAILGLTLINCAFPCYQLWTIESYPTVVRNDKVATQTEKLHQLSKTDLFTLKKS